jgi:hypothetical protein
MSFIRKKQGNENEGCTAVRANQRINGSGMGACPGSYHLAKRCTRCSAKVSWRPGVVRVPVHGGVCIIPQVRSAGAELL